jgi:uncharacterized protein YcaQ
MDSGQPRTPAREISAAVARRFLVLHHLLAPPRALPPEPASVLRVIDRFGSLQFDPIDVAGRNHDLVLAARISGYRREWTDQLLYGSRVLFEAYNKGLSILPTADLPWYRIAWDRAAARHGADAFDIHGPLVEELLGRIRETGPMSASDVKPREAIDWYWRPTNPVRAILEALAEAGVLGLTRRDGNRRVYDLAERLFPADLLAQRKPQREQWRHKLLSRFRAHGLLGRTGSAELWIGTTPRTDLPGDPPKRVTRAELIAALVADEALMPVRVAGIRTERFVLRDDLRLLEQAIDEVREGVPPGGAEAGVAFIAPLDPFAWDRDLLRSLFGFDYLWEVYVPAARRRWGYYVLPVLFGDRIVGRVEPRADRASGVLRILSWSWEDGFEPLAEPGFAAALADALDAHRRFVGARRIRLPATARYRLLAREVRARLASMAR